MSEHSNEKKNRLLTVLVFITVFAVAIAVWALFFRNSGPVMVPDYAPEMEENAEAIPGDMGESCQSSEGEGSVSITYSRDVTVNLEEETAGLYFANPSKSNHDMMLQIVIQNTVVAQSGKLEPGKQLTELNLIKGIANRLSAGVYEGKFAIFYYHPETGEKSIVNTEIPVTITVN